MESLVGRYSLWEIWQDFIVMSAISIANCCHGPHWESREKEYLTRATKYSSNDMSVFSQMLAIVAADLECNPDQDYLGELFMSLGLENEWAGQFFTPYQTCRKAPVFRHGDISHTLFPRFRAYRLVLDIEQ
ncbi:MAG: hypothetical protein IKC03_05355 [Oscillospiraceae bacterium]|nr:hypothetical protein [Oscillospiraceae bacterium]